MQQTIKTTAQNNTTHAHLLLLSFFGAASGGQPSVVLVAVFLAPFLHELMQLAILAQLLVSAMK